MSVTVTQELTQQTVTVTGNPVENNVTVTVSNARGPGGGGSNSITSATTSDGTANLSISNVTTATATVSGTLTANHIHGNLAGSVYAHVRAGEALLKGDPVYVSGSHGSGSTLIAIVSKADAGNAAKMPAFGIMDADLANNATGHMVITGTITELATNAYTVNAELYVAAGGGMTATPPTERAQPVARVERVNANNGAILVKVNGLSASDATPNTLVRRDSSGGANFAGTVNLASGVITDLRFEDYQAAVGATFFYGEGSASAHRTALGSQATGDALFTAATPAAARTTLELATTDRPLFAGLDITYTGSTYAVDVTKTGGSRFGVHLGDTSSTQIGTVNNTSLVFTTLGNSRMVISSSGAVTISNSLATTPATRNGPGPLSVSASSIALTTLAGAPNQLTLANGINGQILTVCHVSRGGNTGTAVLTPATKNGYNTITFTGVGDSVTLQFHTTGGWCVIGSRSVTFA